MRNLLFAPLLAVLLVVGCVAKPWATYNVMDFGAKSDSTVLSTSAIQAAIDKASENGGGKVIVPKGTYMTGTIILKSNVEFHVEKDALILGSLDLNDYADVTGAIEAPAFDKCLVFGEGVQNFKITGEGIIDGRGTKANFPVGKNPDLLQRPMLVRFVNCQNFELTDISFHRAGSWCVHLVDCDDVVARRVKINSRVNLNNDGFDIDGCKRVLIDQCDIFSGDDPLCPKSTTTRICEDITIKNTRADSHTSGLKLGTSSRGGFRNITVDSCDFSNCSAGVIKLLLVDGGIMEDIKISNIKMENVHGGPIFIRLANRGRMYDKPTEQVYGKNTVHEGAPIGSVKNILIENIKAEVVGNRPKFEGMMISGIPGHYIENVTIRNIEVSLPGGMKEGGYQKIVPEDETRYPEQFFFGVLPSWGMFIRHAKNVTLENVQLTTVLPDVRKEIVLDDVIGYVRN